MRYFKYIIALFVTVSFLQSCEPEALPGDYSDKPVFNPISGDDSGKEDVPIDDEKDG